MVRNHAEVRGSVFLTEDQGLDDPITAHIRVSDYKKCSIRIYLQTTSG